MKSIELSKGSKMKTLNKEKVDQFWRSRQSISDSRLATNYRNDGRLELDTMLIKKHHLLNGDLLDLGCGTGTLSEKLLDVSSLIVGVDKYPTFLKKCPNNPKFKPIESDLLSFETSLMFDTILLFGVINYLTSEEESLLYKNCKKWLKPNGVLLVKNQCGIKEDIFVDGHSTELKSEYNARYPWIHKQARTLKELFQVEIIDIYPPEINRWENTHFYAFICK